MAAGTPNLLRRLEMAHGAASQLVSDLLEISKVSENALLTELITPLIGETRAIADKISRYHILASDHPQKS